MVRGQIRVQAELQDGMKRVQADGLSSEIFAP